MSARPGALGVACAVTIALALAPSTWAAQPYTLTHDVRVRIDARLQLMGFGEDRPAHRAILEAAENEELSFTHAFEIGEERLEVDIVMRPMVDLASELCRVTLDVAVRPPGSKPTRLDQTIALGPERVRLVEAWSGSRMEERLVIAFTATWEKIPRVSVLREGAEPVAIVLEVVEGERVLQRHELGAVVGESSRYMVRHAPHVVAGAAETARREARAELVFLPKSIAEGKLDLSVALRVESPREPGEGAEPTIFEMRERLSPGFSILLPLPREAGGGDATRIRVTPWF